MGCALAQGYHFSRPLAPAAVTVWLAARREAAPPGLSASDADAGRWLAVT